MMPLNGDDSSSLSMLQIAEALAAVLGFAGYFLSWPYGREVGFLAVPAGLSLWAMRSGPIARILASFSEVTQRQSIYADLRWESLYWLSVIVLGWLGARLAFQLKPHPKPPVIQALPEAKKATPLYMILVLLISVILSQFFMKTFVQDVCVDHMLVVCQPPIRQLVFGITAAFAATAFIIESLFHLTYVWSLPACGLIYIISTITFTKTDIMTQLADNYPAVCLPHAVLSALPIQIVAFGTIGAVIGYWLAVRYRYWRIHEVS